MTKEGLPLDQVRRFARQWALPLSRDYPARAGHLACRERARFDIAVHAQIFARLVVTTGRAVVRDRQSATSPVSAPAREALFLQLSPAVAARNRITPLPSDNPRTTGG